MNKILIGVLFSISFLFGNHVLTDTAEWNKGDEYIIANVSVSNACSFILKHEDSLDYLDSVRLYYIFDDDSEVQLASFKVTKNDNCELISAIE